MDELIELDAGLLEKAIAAASCGEAKHEWKFIGCGGCCCDLGDGLFGGCSLPVHECENCGDCDYGENEESEQIRTDCKARQSARTDGSNE